MDKLLRIASNWAIDPWIIGRSTKRTATNFSHGSIANTADDLNKNISFCFVDLFVFVEKHAEQEHDWKLWHLYNIDLNSSIPIVQLKHSRQAAKKMVPNDPNTAK